MSIYIIVYQVDNDNRREAIEERLLFMQARPLTSRSWIIESKSSEHELCERLTQVANGPGDIVCVIQPARGLAFRAKDNRHYPEAEAIVLMARVNE